MDSMSSFPFRKLLLDKYLTLYVLMNVDYTDALNFMFATNKDVRSFLITNFITLKNEFENNGLIEYHLKDGLSLFNSIALLEKLYLEVITRNP